MLQLNTHRKLHGCPSKIVGFRRRQKKAIEVVGQEEKVECFLELITFSYSLSNEKMLKIWPIIQEYLLLMAENRKDKDTSFCFHYGFLSRLTTTNFEVTFKTLFAPLQQMPSCKNIAIENCL